MHELSIDPNFFPWRWSRAIAHTELFPAPWAKYSLTAQAFIGILLIYNIIYLYAEKKMSFP